MAAASSIDAKSGREEDMAVGTGADSQAESNGVDSSAIAVEASAPPPQAAAASDDGTSAPEPEVVAPLAEAGSDQPATLVDKEPATAGPTAATDGPQQQSKAYEDETTNSLLVDDESKVDGDVSPAEPPSAPSVAAAAAPEPVLDPGVSKPSPDAKLESSTGTPPVQVETSTLPPMMTSVEAVAQTTTATTDEAAPPPRQVDAEPETATNEQLSAAPPLAKAVESIESVKNDQRSSETVVEPAPVPASATSNPINEAIEAPTPVSTAVAAAAAEAAPSTATTTTEPTSANSTTRANGSAAAAHPLKRTPPLPAGGITMPPALQTMTPKDVRKRFNTHKIACVQTLNVQLIT